MPGVSTGPIVMLVDVFLVGTHLAVFAIGLWIGFLRGLWVGYRRSRGVRA